MDFQFIERDIDIQGVIASHILINEKNFILWYVNCDSWLKREWNLIITTKTRDFGQNIIIL